MPLINTWSYSALLTEALTVCQATERIALLLVLIAAMFAFVPLRHLTLLVFLEAFTREMPYRKESSNRWRRRLKEWWNRIPAAPVQLIKLDENKKKKWTLFIWMSTFSVNWWCQWTSDYWRKSSYSVQKAVEIFNFHFGSPWKTNILGRIVSNLQINWKSFKLLSFKVFQRMHTLLTTCILRAIYLISVCA